MNADKHHPTAEETAAAPEEEEEANEMALLRKTFRQSNSSSTDSDDMYSQDFQEPKSLVIRDEEGTGFSNGSSGLEIGNNDHHVIYEAPIDEIEEAVTLRKTDMQNSTAIKNQYNNIPLSVAANPPPGNGEIMEQNSHYTYLNDRNIENERVEFRRENGNEVADLYLERVYEKPRSHDFYCPNCQACITKVIIRDKEWVNNTTSAAAPVPPQVDKFRCTSCFSFLIPIGVWFFPKLASPEEQVSSELGNDIDNIGIREREILQVPRETGYHQESQEDIAPVPAKSVGSAVPDKNKGELPLSRARPSFKEATVDGKIVQEKTGYTIKVPVPDQSVPADRTLNGDRVVANSAPTHPSLHAEIVEEGVVLDKPVNSIEGNEIESIIVRSPQPLNESKGTVRDQENQSASVNKTEVPDWSTEFNMLVDPKYSEIKIDSTANPTPAYLSLGAVLLDSALDGAKDNKKGFENIVVGIPYSSQESNGSVLVKDSQASSVNEAPVPNQSNGFAIFVESERETKASSRRSPTSLEATRAETIVDSTLDGKKDVENIVVGIPYPSQQPKGGLLNRFNLSSFIKKTPVPDQLAGVAKTGIPKTPEPVVAAAPDSSPDHPSIAAVTAENLLGSAVNRNEGPVAVAISVDDSVEGRVDLEPSWSKKWEILKSIVYGGLAESITSLGIVTSAASADATTGNIVGLALANLISGLFIIGHNLATLKSEHFRSASDETDNVQLHRYEVVLGRRENYILHFTMAILSFLVFGLVPPLVYGFSFRESNDKDFKLAVTAGASLFCIILLAIGKAHIQKPDKWDVYFKTVMSYVVIGAGAGGLSYLAGDLIHMFIKRYGWFEPNPALNLPFPLPEMSLAKPAWASF